MEQKKPFSGVQHFEQLAQGGKMEQETAAAIAATQAHADDRAAATEYSEKRAADANVLRVPAISINHLSHATREGYLSSEYGDGADDLPFMVGQHSNGYFMTVPACAAQADDEQREEFARIPADLRGIFEYMQPRAPFAWFLLDVDGDEVAGLPLGEDVPQDAPMLATLTTEAFLLSDEFEAEILRQYGVTVTDKSRAPYDVVFVGERAELERMYADHWGADAGEPNIK